MKKVYKGLGGLFLTIGFVVMGILAIPTGILISVIDVIWTLTDYLLSWTQKKENNAEKARERRCKGGL